MNPQNASELFAIMSCIRDISIVGCLGFMAFQFRAVSTLVESARTFILEVRVFMSGMTANLNLITNNHLSHLQSSGERIEKTLAGQTEILKSISTTNNSKVKIHE